MIIISCRHKLFKYSYRTKKVVTVNQRCCYCFLFNAWLPVRLHDAILNVTNIVLFKIKGNKIVSRYSKWLTALFNNTRTLKLKAQPTNEFFAAVNQVFGGSSQLTTTAELCSLSELCTTIWLLRARQQSKAGRSRRTSDWMTVAKKAFVVWDSWLRFEF